MEKENKKIMKNYIYFTFILIALFSCTEQEIDTYSGDSYIKFSKAETDTIVYSFALNPLQTEAEIDVVLEFSTLPNNNERPYSVTLNTDESTAILDQEIIWGNLSQKAKPNTYVDTLKVKFKKTERMKSQKVVAVLELKENPYFKPNFLDNKKCVIVVSDKLTQPAWWNSFHISSGLGTYSDKKFNLFIQVTGISDLDYQNNEDLTYSQMREYVLQFKHWLLENPQQEEDNTTMEVKMVG